MDGGGVGRRLCGCKKNRTKGLYLREWVAVDADGRAVVVVLSNLSKD